MALKTFKPTTPSQRQLVLVDRSHLWKGKPVKALTEGLSKSGGRNNAGRVSVWHRGGGHKRTYRMVDFKRTKFGVPGTVERLEYDPNRTAFIALIKYADGELAYILAPQRVAVGDKIVAGEKVDVKPGNAMPLRSIPVGTIVHNVELKMGRGGQLARAAGHPIFAATISRSVPNSGFVNDQVDRCKGGAADRIMTRMDPVPPGHRDRPRPAGLATGRRPALSGWWCGVTVRQARPGADRL